MPSDSSQDVQDATLKKKRALSPKKEKKPVEQPTDDQKENYKDQIDQLHKLLEKQQTLLEHEQQLRLTEIKPATKQIDGQPKKKHWWSFK